MIRKYIGTSHGRPHKKNTANLSSLKRNSQYHVLVTAATKKNYKDAVVKVKPIVKKIGKNYIEMSQLSNFEPEVINVSPTLKIHRVSPRMQRLANLLKNSPIASIRRIGYDIVDI